MPAVLVLTVRFLNPVPMFHGRADEGEPEWPPSPLRVFQALVAAAAGRWKADLFREYAEPALRWLERQPPPEIVAPAGETGTPFRTAVPNNDLDRVARAWSAGNYSNSGDANPATHRSLKTVRPTRLLGGNAVHYAYLLADADPEFERVRESLFAAARSVTHVGWGIDMATMEAKVVNSDVPRAIAEHYWRPVPEGGVSLRTPVVGTLDALVGRHREFLARSLNPAVMDGGTPFTTFGTVGYHSPTAGVGKPPERPVAAFQILAPDASRVLSFSVGRGVRDVAAWVRNATAAVCEGWPFGGVAAFVHGHDSADSNKPLKGAHADARFSYLPLPSIQRLGDRGERVTSIRRVLVSAPAGCAGQVEWVRRRLTGHDLVREDRPTEPVGLLTLLPASDWVLRQYTGESELWSSVTPVLLPGYDDRDPVKAERLLREALGHAGFPAETVVKAELELGQFGFRHGVEPVRKYVPPDNLKKFPAYHVRVRFSRPIAGPLAVGAGRYRGFGLFARDGG